MENYEATEFEIYRAVVAVLEEWIGIHLGDDEFAALAADVAEAARIQHPKWTLVAA